MRIQGLGHLLYLVQFILTGGFRDSDHSVLPYQHLDMAQTILIRWGELVPWCWRTWNDERAADFECIADLVSLNICSPTPHLLMQGTDYPVAISLEFTLLHFGVLATVQSSV